MTDERKAPPTRIVAQRKNTSEIADWLIALANAMEHVLKPATISEYVEIMERWRLSDEEWVALKRDLKLRFDAFPRIAQINDAKSDIVQSRPWIPPWSESDAVH